MKSSDRFKLTIAPRIARWGFTAVLSLLAANASAQTPTITKLWEVPAGTYGDLTISGDNHRGAAISPFTTNVIYGTRVGATNIGVNTGVNNHASTISYASGSNFIAQLKTVTNGSQVNIANVRLADDGRVYGMSVTTAGTGANQIFRIYQWPSETDATSEAIEVFNSTNVFTPPNTSFPFRLGDHMDLRGGGTNTEIVVIGNNAANTNLMFFRPTDAAVTNFTHSIIPVSVTNAAICGNGVTFEGTNNAVWIRQNAVSTTRRVAYDPIALTSTVTRTNNVDTASINGIKHFTFGTNNFLAAVHVNALGTTNRVKIFSIPSTANTAMSLVFTGDLPVPGNANGNGLGAVDVRNNHVVALAPNNGINFYRMSFVFSVAVTRSIFINGDLVAGYPITFTATPNASPNIFQWYYNTNTLIPNATNATYNIPSAQVSDSGVYTVIVSNSIWGLATNSASVVVLPSGVSGLASNLWTLAPGSRPYLTTNDTQRGLTYDSVSNVLVVVSRSPTTNAYVLNADTGADIGVLDTSFLSLGPPGTFKLNMVGAGGDGAIYAANLITSPASDQFVVYRWPSADPAAAYTVAYNLNPAIGRLGDTFAVRGSGTNTEMLCGVSTGTNVALFVSDANTNFTALSIAVTNLPVDAQANGFARLGIAFGPTNTFWAKSVGFNLRQVAYDTNTLTGTVIATYTNLPFGHAPLGADNLRGYVATIGVLDFPQNVSLWDVARGEPDAFQLDRELLGSNNVNGNGTGAIAVDSVNRRIFVLDSNNGIVALSYADYSLAIAPTSQGGIVTWPNSSGNLQSNTNLTTGAGWSDVPAATSPYTNTAAGQTYFRVRR